MKTSDRLQVGDVYTRDQLRVRFDISDKTIDTGVFRPKGSDSIWLFVTERKTADRTQYSDFLSGDTLDWDGQLSGRTDEMIITHRRHNLELLVFYRRRKYEYPGAGFRFEGEFEYSSHQEKRPTHFTLRRTTTIEGMVCSDLDALRYEDEYFEGEVVERFTSHYERNPKLRAAAIRAHGLQCRVCGFDFEKTYGVRGAGYIEVHHLRQVCSLGGTVKVDPLVDMTVLCANCHRMIHRRQDQVMTPEALLSIVIQTRQTGG